MQSEEDVKEKGSAKRKDPDRRLRIRRLILFSAGGTVVLLIALIAYFFPFRNLLPALAVPERGEGEMRVHFIDVGEGDATLVEFADGQCLLIDAGDGDFLHGDHLLRYLRGVDMKGLTVLATHSDADHCGGISSVLEKFGAQKLYLPVVGGSTGAYLSMLDAAEKGQIATETFTRYDTIENETGAYAVCLSPYSIDEVNENDSSALIYLTYGGVNFLFGADISSVRERRLLREYAVDPTLFDSGNCTVDLADIDILRVSHHGSASSSSYEWLSLLDPQVAIISCGRGNRYAHPAEEAVQTLSVFCEEIMRIDELGDIMITVSGGTYTARVLSL